MEDGTNNVHSLVKEMCIGDIIVVPSPNKRDIYFAKIESNYIYDKTIDKELGYPHQRKVEWLLNKKSILRSDLPEELRGSLRYPGTVADLTKHAQLIEGLLNKSIEQFKNELQTYGLIKNDKLLDKRALSTFQQAIQYKEINEYNWNDAMQRAIQEEYGEEMLSHFSWKTEIILKNLIWKIKHKKIDVISINNTVSEGNEDFHVIYQIIIDNFEELGKEIPIYKYSSGTDGNPITTFICKGKDHMYYLVGKYNSFTKSEDMHVFYNDDTEFNIMKCTHICGGSSNKGKLKDLWNICSTYSSKLKQ